MITERRPTTTGTIPGRPGQWYGVTAALLMAAVASAAELAPPEYGVNIHFTDPRPGEMEMLAASGCRWVRMDLTWARTEKTAGEYDFAPYDRLVSALDRHGLRVLFILDYGNPLYDGGLAPHTETGRAAFARWAAAAVSRYRGRGYFWEIWNEPNHPNFWKPQPNVADYVALARAVARAVREAAPEERLIGPATSKIDFEFIEGCFRGGVLEDWWAVSVHPYRQTDPETVMAEYGRLRDMIRRYAPAGREVPVLSGEWGYSTAWRGVDADRQGTLLARQWLVNAAAGIPLSIWYDWRDDGADPAEPEHNFGTVRHRRLAGWPPFDPKPAWHAMRAFHGELDGHRFVRRVSLARTSGEADPGDWMLLFERSGRWRLAMWTLSTGGTSVVRVPGVRGIRTHLGQAWGPPAAHPGGEDLEVRLGLSPLYADLAPSAAVELSRPGRWDWSDGRIEAIEAGLGAGGRLWLELRKSHGPAMGGRVRVLTDGPTNEWSWSAGEGEAVVRVATGMPAADVPMQIEVAREDGAVVAVRRRFRLKPIAGWGAAPMKVGANTDGRPAVRHQISLEHIAVPDDCPAAPGEAVRISVATEAGYQYFPVTFDRPGDRRIEGRPHALLLWARAEGDPLRLTCRVEDSSGEVFQPYRVDVVPDSGWRLIRLPWMAAGTGRWGGDQDGVPTPPLKWQAALLLDRDHARGQTGAVIVAGAAFLYDEPQQR